jgi:hypothetical protein
VEGCDYVIFNASVKNPKGGRPTIDYVLSLDMAKEIAMVEKNEQGQKVRRYFIECERRALEAARETELMTVPRIDADHVIRAVIGGLSQRLANLKPDVRVNLDEKVIAQLVRSSTKDILNQVLLKNLVTQSQWAEYEDKLGDAFRAIKHAIVEHPRQAETVGVKGVYRIAELENPPRPQSLSNNVSRSLTSYCVRHKAVIDVDDETGRYRWEKAAVVEWLKAEGRSMIDRHIAKYRQADNVIQLPFPQDRDADTRS